LSAGLAKLRDFRRCTYGYNPVSGDGDRFSLGRAQLTRALVVSDRVVAWVERRARPGRLLHTLAGGASLKAVRVPAALDKLAVEAARVVGLDVAAVDLLEANTGPMVFDVNSSPGLQGLEAATGRLVAIARYVAGTLAAAGETLRAGQVIIAGSIIPAMALSPDDCEIAYDVKGLGGVSVRFGA